MYKEKLKNIVINENSNVYEAYWKYQHNPQRILIVINDDDEFVGVITANEINKININPEISVSEIVNKKCKSVQHNDNKSIMDNDLGKIFALSKNINCIPILKGKRVIDLYTRKNYASEHKELCTPDIKGNYTPLIKSIVNEYLGSTYNLNIDKLDNLITKYLVNQKTIYETKIDDIIFHFEDSVISNTITSVSKELNESEEYNFKEMDFKEGDVVIDIGGNIGMVSIYLAKKFPFLKIYAYEPVKQNYESFLHNIKLNNIPEGTITVENKAVTCDGRTISMAINKTNSGGSSISDVIAVGAITQKENSNIESTTLGNIFKTHNINYLRLLKIDCEGSEYEILNNTDTNILKKISSLRGEFHENKDLTDKYDIDNLYNFVSEYIEDINVYKARDCFVM